MAENTKKPPGSRRSHVEDEDCQDKVCDDTKTNIKGWMKRGKVVSEVECPLDRNTLGNATWALLHTMASKYPVQPKQQEKDDMKEFIRLMSVLYPCSYCAAEFREDIASLPPKLDSRDTLSQWFCQIHNKVNKKLNKPQFDCSKVDERWRTGWKDGSCLDMYF